MFKNNINVKIGCLFFEKKTPEELFSTAYGLWELYLKSGKKDAVSGTMAIEAAVAAFFEGHQKAAALVSFCLWEGVSYRNATDNTKLRMLFDTYNELGADASSLCAYRMGVEYEKGRPPFIVANEYMAALWYKKAADMGEVNAQAEMGHRYFDGNGVEVDFQMAEAYWEMAAKQGDVTSQYNLGCLCDGSLSGGPSTTTYDPAKAGMWLAEAARNGSEEAAEILNRSYRYNKLWKRWQKID